MSSAFDAQDQELIAVAAAEHDRVDRDVKYGAEGKLESDSDVASVPAVDADGEVWVHPTDEERAGPNALPRVIDQIPWNAYLIGLVELAERFSFYGSSAVFVNFLQQPLPPNGNRAGAGGHDHVSGALGMKQQVSTGLTTFYQFWCYVVPLFGAYVADTRLGRFETICWSVLIALVGHILMIVSAIPSVIANQHASLGVFVLSIIVTGLGTGGFKANISPLVAEQYKVTALRVKTLKNGQRVIVDPALTVSRIYMWYYFLINVGALVGQIGMTYSEKYVGFWLAYTLPTIVFLLCPTVLYLGRNRYQRSPPQGSVLGTSMRIWRLAIKGTFSWNPLTLWRNCQKPGFWEKAKPSNYLQTTGGERPKWMTFDDEYVDEVRRGFKACQVFIFYPLYWLSYNQINNNLTSQAASMTTNGVPNDVINNLDPFALLIFIPICAKYIYPGLARMKIRFTPIRRIFMGFMTGVAAMIWAAVVQVYIYRTSPCGNQASTCAEPSPLNVWIQTGSYVLIAFSEIFASISGLEYAFTKAPKNMRSLVMAVFLFQTALSSAIGEAMNPLVVDPLLTWNYGVAAIIGFVAGILFWICFRHLDKEEDTLNEIGAKRADAMGIEDVPVSEKRAA